MYHFWTTLYLLLMAVQGKELTNLKLPVSFSCSYISLKSIFTINMIVGMSILSLIPFIFRMITRYDLKNEKHPSEKINVIKSFVNFIVNHILLYIDYMN